MESDGVKETVTEINSRTKKWTEKLLGPLLQAQFQKTRPKEKKVQQQEEKLEPEEKYLVQKDRFVPSAQLIQNYQKLYRSSLNEIQEVVPPANPLPQLFGKTFTSTDANKVDTGSRPQTVHNFVEQRQEAMLTGLKDGKLEGTLSNMEQSLRRFELSNLDSKQVRIENVLSLDQWKQRRQQMLNKFN